MYAIIGILDDQTQSFVRDVWRQLEANGLSDYAQQVKNREPHITLASFDMPELNEVRNILNHYARQTKLPLTFNTVSHFLGVNIVTFNPVKSSRLVALHCDVHQRLGQHSLPSSLYHPDNWVPHVTIANRIEEGLFAETYTYCRKHCRVIEGEMVGFKFIQIDGDRLSELHRISFK